MFGITLYEADMILIFQILCFEPRTLEIAGSSVGGAVEVSMAITLVMTTKYGTRS